MFPGWQNVGDYEDTEEGSGTVAIHSSGMDQKLKERVIFLRETDPSFKEIRYSQDMKFLCRSMGVEIPFLPVCRPKEIKLFSNIMLDVVNKFDSEKMALLWVDHVDGREIFPKLPVQLRKYHKKWDVNRRIKTGQEAMKKQNELLMKELSERVPSELYQRRKQPHGASVAAQGEDVLILPIQQTGNQVPIWQHQRVMWRNPVMPLAMPVQLPYSNLRPPGSGHIMVQGETIGVQLPTQSTAAKGTQSMQSKGSRPRRCGACMDSGDAVRIANAHFCNGRGARRLCNFNNNE
jgi:hypothetical protein